MNFIWEAVASWHGDSKTIPKRCFRRRVDLRSPVSGARSRRRTPAHPRVALGGLERTEVGGENRLCLALYATRAPSAVGSCIPADEEVATGGRLREDSPRFAPTLATFGRQSARSDGSHTRLSHPALYPGERLSGRLRWSEAQEGFARRYTQRWTL